jgi:hypothetical protein
MSGNSPPRRPLHERSDSDANTRALGGIRVVPSTPPQLLGQRDEVFGRTPLPTHPSHILSPGKSRGKDYALQSEFQPTSKAPASASSSGSSASTTHLPLQPSQHGESATGTPISKQKPVPKKRLLVHKDSKTFSLVSVPQDEPQPTNERPLSPKSPTVSTKSSYDLLPLDNRGAISRSNSIKSCEPEPLTRGSSALVPTTPLPETTQDIPADPISNSPWNYQLVGGLRKVPKTPDLKQKAAATSELSPLQETADISTTLSHDLSTKPSFQSTETATTASGSENTNYKVYQNDSATASEAALAPPSSSDSNYQRIGEPSPESSVIYRPQTAVSENENYELHGDPSPAASYTDLLHPSKYSQESLIIPPLNTRSRRSNEHYGYYKSRSRESLRTGSLTSISTVLSQQEASRAIVGSGSLINLPALGSKLKVTGSWADPLRSHMNEHPHQWSSQLSTVHSVSEGGTDRGSQSWSDSGRRSSQFVPSTPSRNSRNVLSISSSLAQELAEEGAARRGSVSPISPPLPIFTRNGQRHHSSSSIRVVGDQDEYGDGITDMQELRPRPSRTRLSGFFSVTSSDNGRTNTMRSTSSSMRANSMLASTIPTWARLYYGSGERRYLGTLGAPGSSTEGTDSRASSFRSGSPNTDHFPLSIYSPRRRPRQLDPGAGSSGNRGSLEITPAPLGSDGQIINDPYTRRFRTWSMSSIWSPHLRMDRRATRHSVWDPPSVNWSTEGGWFGRRNVQIVMFVLGFIFPFGKGLIAPHILSLCSQSK